MRRSVFCACTIGLALLSMQFAACSTDQHATPASPNEPASMLSAGAAQSGAAGDSAGHAAVADALDAGAVARSVSGAAGAAAGSGGTTLTPSAAGTGSPAADGGAPVDGSVGAVASAGASGMSGAAAGAGGATTSDGFALSPVGATMLSADEFTFPANALPPSNRSPGFTWTGVPHDAKSLVLVFRDLTAGAVKWILWDMSPTVTHVPSGISSQANPPELPGSSQLGSLGNQGYAGPCCPNNQYEFVLWALDVEKLPSTAGQTTAQIRQSLLPSHQIASTKPVIMHIMR